jgi:hypothetical protein
LEVTGEMVAGIRKGSEYSGETAERQLRLQQLDFVNPWVGGSKSKIHQAMEGCDNCARRSHDSVSSTVKLYDPVNSLFPAMSIWLR